jgi:glyoxylase-like metal-dependent hydrolase (beta-lactamase superfamily II)
VPSSLQTLDFPFPEAPAPGSVIKVADGILWARVPLPFKLDHVNIYLIEDDGGWAVVDTGIGDARTIAAWQALLEGPLAGAKLTRLIVTHFHPDHIGLAGWLCEKHDMPLLTTQTCYLGCLNISLSPGASDSQIYHDFYRSHGLAEDVTKLVGTLGHAYLRQVLPLPATFQRLVAGDKLKIGRFDFEVLSGDGHAPEQLMLYAREQGIFLAADQVLAKITPNISVWAVEPKGDPLGLYLRSLRALQDQIARDVLVLPGHQLPFHGLHDRCAELAAHHFERCDRILESCKASPRTVAELVPVLFTRPLDPHQLSFAFSETLAHVNLLVHQGRLAWSKTCEGLQQVTLT